MTFQGLSFKECALITCPVCEKFFNETDQRPIALQCGHTVCKYCVKQEFKNNCCPFDQYALQGDVESMPSNYILMPLVERAMLAEAAEERAARRERPEMDPVRCYQLAVKHVEEMAKHLEPLKLEKEEGEELTSVIEGEEDSTSVSSSTPRTLSPPPRCMLSQQMQRKVISLIHCQLLEEEGRARAARLSHTMAARAVQEMLAALASPSQLSTSLWAAVRTRGCQFLGPAMQEEVLKLIVLALDDGNFLSRKTLVLFVVQRLAAQYPQASKTAIGHVVQLLYRASCFKVVKKEEESSVMQLKEEFRCYEALRREHDTQIVTIAAEAGLRISPEQWSSLLYGDNGHKSHMQSIIDKHQSPHTFTQSVIELMATLQRTGDTANLAQLRPQLEFLSSIDPNPDCPAPSWKNVEAIMRSLNTVLTSLVNFLSLPSSQKCSEPTQQGGRFKTSMCRDFLSRGSCPRGINCTFAHSHLELDRYRSRSRRGGQKPTCQSSCGGDIDQLCDDQLQLLSQLSLNQPMTGSPQSPSELNVSLAGAAQGIEACGPSFLPQGGHTAPGATQLTFTQGAARAPDCMRAPAASHQTFFHPHNQVPPPQVPPPHNQPLQNNSADSYMTNGFPGAGCHKYPPPVTSLHPSLPISTPHCVHTPPGNYCFQCPPPPPSPVLPTPPTCLHCPPPTHGPRAPEAGFGHHFSSLSPCHSTGGCNTSNGTTQAVPVSQAVAVSNGEGLVVPCTNQDPTLVRKNTASLQTNKQSLASLQCRKQALISHLHDAPVFMRPGAGVYQADNHRAGFAGLKTVLGNNKRTKSAMPKLVSDMFVATRSTQSLDEMLNDDISLNSLPPTSWPMSEEPASCVRETEAETTSCSNISNINLFHSNISNSVLPNLGNQAPGLTNSLSHANTLSLNLSPLPFQHIPTINMSSQNVPPVNHSEQTLTISNLSTPINIQPPSLKLNSQLSLPHCSEPAFPHLADHTRSHPSDLKQSSMSDIQADFSHHTSDTSSGWQGTAFQTSPNRKFYNSLESTSEASRQSDVCNMTQQQQARPYRLFTQEESFVDDLILTPSEFSSFPSDEGDEHLIPLAHTYVSKFGPISRMAKAKTDNAAPVQVTADSCRRITPALTANMLERRPSVVSVVSGQCGQTRHCSAPATGPSGAQESGEPSVKPTPSEKPSVWQHTPSPSYQNIALLRAGAAEAVSNNERLAYELQAVELEISMKTGQDPESVGEMIQSAVMSSDTPAQTCPGFAPLSHGGQGEMGLGHVTECLTMVSSDRSSWQSQEQLRGHLKSLHVSQAARSPVWSLNSC